MQHAAQILIILVALQHLGFLVLEAFLWTAPLGRKVFRNSEETARLTAPLAKNMGLYNGFLAAGLLWGYCARDRETMTFFAACVVIAGIVGALTVSRRIFWIQGLPAVIALGLLWASSGSALG